MDFINFLAILLLYKYAEMPLQNTISGEYIDSSIEEVLEKDYQKIEGSSEFQFNWRIEKKNKVYKIILFNKKKDIIGLMSLIDWPEEYRIHLNLIEVGLSYRGKGKKIDNIAGCLLAYACRLAFQRNYGGFVSLQPKTQLINLYQNKYGFRQYGRLLAVEHSSAEVLIDTYLPYEE